MQLRLTILVASSYCQDLIKCSCVCKATTFIRLTTTTSTTAHRCSLLLPQIILQFKRRVHVSRRQISLAIGTSHFNYVTIHQWTCVNLQCWLTTNHRCVRSRKRLFFFPRNSYLHVTYFHEIVTATSPVVWGWGGKNDGEQDWICVARSC